MQKITTVEKKIREKVNNTLKKIPDRLLHEDFFLKAIEKPENIALVWIEDSGIKKEMTYGEVYEKALKCAAYLRENGVKANENVGISMKKGPNQVIGILGILAVGAVYVPIGVHQPETRRNLIYKMAEIKFVLTDDDSRGDLPHASEIQLLCVENSENYQVCVEYEKISSNNNAYIIFTSGTTGVPKGVVVQHCSAYNTIWDINNKFSVSEKDTIIAISELDFDLSVYDLFGILGAGGKVVLLNEDNKKEARIWKELIHKESVTIWNSVPTFFEMLLIGYGVQNMDSSMRLVLLSGDWIKPELFLKLREKSTMCQMVALGGATECSIWSNYFIVDEIKKEWKSIPYGYPLSNQVYRIVDEAGDECPNYTPGKIQIGGKGLAKEYCNNLELTREKFIYEGDIRWYETGDIGQYWDNGCIEFLGRNDEQIKLGGYRIELGEIENTLLEYTEIKDASVVLAKNGDKKFLAVAIVPNGFGQMDYDNEDISDVTKEVDSLLEEQACAVVAFLIKLLGLKKDTITTVDEIMCQNSFAEEKQSLVALWIQWLVGEKVLSADCQKIKAGECFEKAFTKNQISLLIETEIDYVRNILKGNIPEQDMVNNSVLSVEKMIFGDRGLDEIVYLVVKEIRGAIKDFESISVAFLQSRTGMFAEKVMENLKNEKIDFTLLDSLAMNSKAQVRLEKMEKRCHYETLYEEYVNDNLMHTFDIIVSINALHTYGDLEKGIQTVRHLLKKDGKLIASEITHFPPLSLITAAVIENGFSRYTKNNRPSANNPMLKVNEWKKLFVKTGFVNINVRNIGKSLSDLFVMELDSESGFISHVDILKNLKKHIPEYMIPEKILTFFSLPLNTNGKVDKNKIKEIFQRNCVNDDSRILGILDTQTEKDIADLWKQILNITEILRSDSFFALGGDSLLATHFTNLVKEKYGVELALKEMFENPILKDIAYIIDYKINERKQFDYMMEEGEI